MQMYDLIVIGAGPAGSAAGRHAAKLGLKTLIIEKEVFPRYKPCAGGLSEKAISYLDFSLPPEIIKKEIFGTRLHHAGRVIEKSKNCRLGALVSRSKLDNFLLTKAEEMQVKIKMGEKVTSCDETGNYVAVNTFKGTYRARHVIIAEGAHGKLKYLVRKQASKKDLFFSVVTEVPDPARVIDNHVLDIHLGISKKGYGWVFPHEDYLSVGIAGSLKDFKRPRQALNDFLNRNCFNSGNGFKIRGHLIPAGKIRADLSSARILLCGDAAGFVDSFSGEGIAYAIRSGQLAAKAVADNLSHNNSQYRSDCIKEFGPNLNYSYYFARLIHSFPKTFFPLYTSESDFINEYMDIFTGKSNYRNYLKWLIPRLPKKLSGGRGC